MTKIIICTCTHAGQDKLHGKNKRVGNKLECKIKPEYRCTVCNKIAE
jgi:hypothetical protein